MNENLNIVQVQGQYTADPEIAMKWLEKAEKHGEFACDFEAKVRYTEDELQLLKDITENEKFSYLERKKAQAVIDATALGHPIHSEITHFSFTTAEDMGYVIVTETQELRDLVYDFLVTTEATQVWHNAAYDFKHIYFHRRKFPKVYEDTAIFAKTLINHVETYKARTGLKELAGHRYGQWALAAEDFSMPDLWDQTLLLYAATDAAATWYIWRSLCDKTAGQLDFIPKTNARYSPWDQLKSAPSPIGADYPPSFFYHYTAKWLIRGTVRIMLTGVPMSMERVEDLETTLEDVLEDVHDRIAGNKVIQQFLEKRQEERIEEYRKQQRSRMRSPDHYYKDFDPGKALDRSYFMDIFAERVGIDLPQEKYPSGVSKWSAALVRKLSAEYLPLRGLVNKTLKPSNATATEAAWNIARDRAAAFNKRYEDNIREPDLPMEPLNPGSSKQKQEVFTWLGIESEATSATTGDPSWNKEQVERVYHETDDEDIKAFTKCLLEFSESAIVRNNFIQAFYRYTVDSVLYGTYRLLGAKSGRYTSQQPKLLGFTEVTPCRKKPKQGNSSCWDVAV